jgi:mannan endo-1,4-beta-mannosidase
MANAHGYGIKLLISIHSYNALDTKADVYGNWYGTGDFYTNTDAIGYFKRRIDHVLSHVNPHNNKPWSESSEYIFAIEAQNEAMHGQVSSLLIIRKRKTRLINDRKMYPHWKLGSAIWQRK